MRRSGPLRLFRSLLVTGTVLSLAAGAHVLGGGTLPAAGVVLALAAFVLLPVTLLAVRRLTFAVLLGVQGGGQLLLHEAFGLFAGHAPGRGPAAHVHAAMVIDFPAVPVDSAGSLPMLGAHALAVLATAWVLAKGEAAFWLLLLWLRPRLRLPRHVMVRQQEPLRIFHDVCFVPSRRNLRWDSLRGPPAAPPACP